MDSRVIQSQVHENDEHYPRIVASEQVTHGAEEHHFDHEKKSVLNKVKAKAKKIKDTIKKRGHQVLDRGHEYNNEDQHTLDHDLDDDEEMAQDPQVHQTPIHESEDVEFARPTSEQVENLGKSGIDFGGTTVMGEELDDDAPLGGPCSTTEIDQNIASDPAKTFSVEEKAGLLPKDNLERSIGFEEEPHALGTDPSGVVKDDYEIEETIAVEESFAKMNVHVEPEPNIQPRVVDLEYSPAGSRDQFVTHLSAESHDQFTQVKISTNVSRSLENPSETGQTFSTITRFTTTANEQLLYESSTDEVVSPKDVLASEVGLGEKDDTKDKVVTNEEQQKCVNASNLSGSTAQYGKNFAHSLTQKFTPVYEKVAGVGSAVNSEVTGAETKNEAKEQDKGVSVKDYLAEKLRPGEEDKALSEVISEALHKRKEETVKQVHGNLDGGDEKMCGKGVVDKLKGVVGSWFGKSEERGGEDLSKNANSGAQVEQVNQVVGEKKISPIEEQGTR
ncbi:Low-temperature-induced 65 kDa protein [Mucuna pruriens]|uniref:Low-temperature-induced 65 kDa protein n=1 Tax=Mucuna pruriens TaxID=157652 RepID=A0A371ICP2_MUCPR|nr:Low-temperature-induced 65 kDa protein [Mucuna pruriens]